MLKANRAVGVPYTKDKIDHAKDDLEAQADPDADGVDAISRSAIPRRRRATSTAIPKQITEVDALIAYLQMLGTLVDFKTYQADAPGKPEIDDGTLGYEDVLAFAQSWGAVYFTLMFAGRLRLRLWPTNQAALRRGRADSARGRG